MKEKKTILELTRVSASDYRKMRKLPLAVMADNVRSMHNIGSFFRTADAFLVSELILAGISGRPPHPEISKTALGAERSVSWRHVEDSVAEAARMKAEGWKILALEQAHDSVELSGFMPEAGCRYLLVVGNEVEGVRQEIVDMADAVLEIEQCGTKHSLNASVSAGTAMYELFRKLR